MNIERLTHLVTVLEGVRDARLGFDLNTFADAPYQPHACGTTACAAGYAALDPTFQAEGLRLAVIMTDRPTERERHTSEPAGLAAFNQVVSHPALVFYQAMPVYEGESSFEAAASFFGIGMEAAFCLFDPLQYRSREENGPQAVIDRVRALLGGGEKELIEGYYLGEDGYEDEDEDEGLDEDEGGE